MFDAISSCNPQGECILTLYPKYGHGELAREFYKDTLYNWLFQFKLGDTPSFLEEKSPVLEVAGVENYPDSLIREKPTVELVQAATKTNNNAAVHIVKRGDTLSSIARKNNTTVTKLCKLNGLKETSVLQLGQKIKLR